MMNFASNFRVYLFSKKKMQIDINIDRKIVRIMRWFFTMFIKVLTLV